MAEIKYKTCPMCSGTGRKITYMPTMIGKITTLMPHYTICSYCCGSGKVKE